MPAIYRRPGVYLEESLLISPSDVAGTYTVAAFVGVAVKGRPTNPSLSSPGATTSPSSVASN